MGKDIVEKQIEYLNDKIKRHLYHLQMYDERIISNTELRKLIEELDMLFEEYPHLKLTQHPARVNYTEPQKYKKYEVAEIKKFHKVYSEKEVLDFINKINDISGKEKVLLYIEKNYISHTVRLTYIYGNLYRGLLLNGVAGEDITENIINITDIPKYIPELKKVDSLTVDCELYLENIDCEGDPYEFTYNTIRGFTEIVDKNKVRSVTNTLLDSSQIVATSINRTVQRLRGYGFTVSYYEVTRDIDRILEFMRVTHKDEAIGTNIIVNSISLQEKIHTDTNMWGMSYLQKG